MKTIVYNNKLTKMYDAWKAYNRSKENYYHVLILIDSKECGKGQIYPFWDKCILEGGGIEDDLENTINQLKNNDDITKAEIQYFRTFYTKENRMKYQNPTRILYKKLIIK